MKGKRKKVTKKKPKTIRDLEAEVKQLKQKLCSETEQTDIYEDCYNGRESYVFKLETKTEQDLLTIADLRADVARARNAAYEEFLNFQKLEVHFNQFRDMYNEQGVEIERITDIAFVFTVMFLSTPDDRPGDLTSRIRIFNLFCQKVEVDPTLIAKELEEVMILGSAAVIPLLFEQVQEAAMDSRNLEDDIQVDALQDNMEELLDAIRALRDNRRK